MTVATQNDLLQLIQIVDDLRQRVEDLESIIDESRDMVVSTAFPTDGYAGQIVLRTDQPGANGGGTLYRFDAGTNTWLQV